VRGAEAQVPADAGVGARDLDDHAIEGVQAELVATEPSRLEDLMEAGCHELVVKPARVRPALLGVGGLGQHCFAHGGGARDDLIGRQLRLGYRDARGDRHRDYAARLGTITPLRSRFSADA
jgi:hypothetical protein